MVRVLHVLDHSLPLQSGYAFRSNSILTTLQDLGVDVAALTSPKHDGGEHTEINGIEYHRTCSTELGSGPIGQYRCIMATRKVLKSLVAEMKPDVLHAHSPCLNALAAFGLGVPVLYEIRSSWEDAAVSSGTTAEGSLRYRASRLLETFAARRADRVTLLCQGLMDEFALRGIRDEKMSIVGNAVNESAMTAPHPEAVAKLRSALGYNDKFVLGFFGSYFDWEGLDCLLEAMPLIHARCPDVTVCFAGGGEAEQNLKLQAERLGITSAVHFAGRVDHAEMPKYYGMADMMVFPRKDLRITQMVTPLKPLEAYFFGTPVIASNVGGHREMVESGKTGALFEPDDPQSLAKTVIELYENSELRSNLIKAGRTYLQRERTWPRMAEKYLSIYQELAHPSS